MSSLLKKLKKVGSKAVAQKTLSETDFFDLDKHASPLEELVFNLALSGKVLGGGLGPGVTVLAGQSKSYKTIAGIRMIKAYLDKYPDAVCIFYDSEFSALEYWTAIGVDLERVIHIPVKNLEHLKFDMNLKLEALVPGEDRCCFFIDSIGMLASKKESEDALKENSAADMTRAKEIKGYFRTITPTLNICHSPLVAINNTYKSMDRIPQDVMGGGGGILLAANTVLFFSKVKLKDADAAGVIENDLAGHTFKIVIHKSRFIKEGSRLQFDVYYGSTGPDRYTGLYEMAEKTGDIYTPSKGWRAARLVDSDGKVLPVEEHPKFREKDVRTDAEFWNETMFKKTNFIKNVEHRLSLTSVIEGDFADFTNKELVSYDPETGEILADEDTEE